MTASDVGAKIRRQELKAISAFLQRAAKDAVLDFYNKPMGAGGVINDQDRCMEIVRRALEEMSGVSIEVEG